MSKHVHLFIFSKGRVGRQKTLNYIPDFIKRNHLTFVTPKSEIDQHKEHEYSRGLDFLGAPEDIHLANKRIKVVQRYQRSGGKFFMMLDDDLRLSALDHSTVNTGTPKYISARTDEGKELFGETFKTVIPRLFKQYDAIGAACRFRAPEYIKDHGFIKTNTKCCNFFGYDADKILSRLPEEAITNMWMLDTTWNLATIQSGQTNASFYDLLWDSDFATEKSPGGCNLYRTTESSNQAFLRGMLLFPGLLSRGREGVHHTSFLKIAWKDAHKTGDDMIERGYANFVKELIHQGLSSRDFLRALPDANRSYYVKRIKELSWLD